MFLALAYLHCFTFLSFVVLSYLHLPNNCFPYLVFPSLHILPFLTLPSLPYLSYLPYLSLHYLSFPDCTLPHLI